MGQFVKGDPRINRRGRPKKGQTITDILGLLLDREKDGELRRVTVAEKLIELAIKGDVAALKYLVDRLDGKPRETFTLGDGAVDRKLREIFEDGNNL